MDRSLVFLSVTASYSHTNLAAWTLRAGVEAAGWQWHEIEVTQNESLSITLNRVARLNPRVVAATFYLFNRPFLLSFLGRFKRLFPDCRVLGGGPEFLGDNRAFLERYPEVDAVIRGEGEKAFGQWLQLMDQPKRQAGIPGFCGLVNRRYVDNGMAEGVECLDDIPSPYPARLAGFCKPFVLLETSRGCSNRCAFCTSGVGGKVRFFSLERVCRDVELIRAQGVPEVRLVDRTFNAQPARSMALLRFFRDECKPLRFHLEIDPARLTLDFIAELAAAEPGRFHLEVGIQSLNPDVIRAIGRQGTVRRALAGLARLCAHRQLATHVDLIAGLPGGTLADLFKELRTLVLLGPAEIQLELLKLLPGTRLAEEKDQWQIVAAPEPPYEVLRIATMTMADLETARGLSNLADWFYNVPELQALMVMATRRIPEYWQELIMFGGNMAFAMAAPSLENRFRLLDDFFRDRNAGSDRDLLLRHALHYAWLKHGFSAQHGICRASPWKGKIPESAVLVEGAAIMRPARVFRADLDRNYLFAYVRERPAAAVYCLEA
ncbi:MAG: radical SAM protein [Kiritimatiellae bacterium]|nr:radical SAM protein [Kiritimatiellia bacterium]